MLCTRLRAGELGEFYTCQSATDAAFPCALVERLNSEQRHVLADEIRKALLWTKDGRGYKKSTSSETTARSICSASGNPTTIISALSASMRVNCNYAKFAVGPERVVFSLNHVSECKPLSLKEKEKRLLRQSATGELEKEAIEDLLPSLDAARDRDVNLKDRIRAFYKTKIPDTVMPEALLLRIIRKAKTTANLSISPEASVVPETMALPASAPQIASKRAGIEADQIAGPSKRSRKRS